MSNKIGFMLSLVFLMHAILFTLDLLTYQTAYSKIELIAANARSLIIKDRALDRAIAYAGDAGATLVCKEGCSNIQAGNFLTFEVSISYSPLFTNQGSNAVTVTKRLIV